MFKGKVLSFLMTIQKFESLSDTDKLDVVWTEGKFLSNFEEGDDLCDMYDLHGFYVGVCFNKYKNSTARIFAISLQERDSTDD